MRLIMVRLKERSMSFDEIVELVSKPPGNRLVTRSVHNYLAELVALGFANHDTQNRVYEWTGNVRVLTAHDLRNALNHSKDLVLSTRKKQRLDRMDMYAALDFLVFPSDASIEDQCLIQHLKTGYYKEIYAPMEEYRQLMNKTGLCDIPGFPKLARLRDVDISEMKGEIVIDRNAAVLGAKSRNLTRIRRKDLRQLLDMESLLVVRIKSLLYSVRMRIPLRGRCDYCPTEEMSVEKKRERNLSAS